MEIDNAYIEKCKQLIEDRIVDYDTALANENEEEMNNVVVDMYTLLLSIRNLFVTGGRA